MPPDDVLERLGYMPMRAPGITTSTQARTATLELLSREVDAIKIHLQPPPTEHPPFPKDAIPIIVVEAHRHRRPVFVHPHTTDDVIASIRAGVDVIAHTTPDSDPWDGAVLDVARDADVALTPTLTLWKNVFRQEALANTAIDQLRGWNDCGLPVLFGTDLGPVAPDPRTEYHLMTDAGMTVTQILRSLTTAPASRFASTHTSGRLAPGCRADIAVLRGRPVKDATALADVRLTIRNGVVVYRDGEH